jgi:hypothetical protein
VWMLMTDEIGCLFVQSFLYIVNIVLAYSYNY